MTDPIGRVLSSARENAGLTLAEMARITRIPASSIYALEEGRFDSLPAPVFVRGFIRSYCHEVGLAPSDILAQYDGYLHEKSLRNQEDPAPQFRPALLPRAEMSGRGNRGLELSHVFLVLLAIVSFIIAYLSAGVPTNHAVDTAQSLPSQESTLNNPSSR
jgi:cytoskeletal protein RodZ